MVLSPAAGWAGEDRATGTGAASGAATGRGVGDAPPSLALVLGLVLVLVRLAAIATAAPPVKSSAVRVALLALLLDSSVRAACSDKRGHDGDKAVGRVAASLFYHPAA